MNTLIEKWFLVEIYTDKSKEDNIDLGISLLWGIVVEDYRLKFQHGSFVCTSNIAQRLSDNEFLTRSGTAYETVGTGERVKIHANDLPKLMNGFSPIEILAAQNQGGSLVNAAYH